MELVNNAQPMNLPKVAAMYKWPQNKGRFVLKTGQGTLHTRPLYRGNSLASSSVFQLKLLGKTWHSVNGTQNFKKMFTDISTKWMI